MRRDISLAIIILTLFATILASVSAVTDKQVYDLGEQVTILSPPGITSSITIIGPSARFRLIGDPGERQVFSPREPGNYSVTLLDREGAMLVTSDFVVKELPQASVHTIAIDPLRPQVDKPVTLRLDPDPIGEIDVTIEAPGGKFRYLGPWTDAQFVPKAAGMHDAVFMREGTVIARLRFEVLPQTHLISTDKESYTSGELITITTAPGIGSDWNLIIISGTQSSRYLGVDRTITFMPLETGQQVLRAVSADGRVLDEITVHAVRSETAIASGGFLLEDSKGVQRTRETRVMQTPFGREIELLSPVAPVNSIRFRGLRDGVLQRLRIEEVQGTSVHGRPSVQSYAIDPTGLDFANATVTAKAVGTELYKCEQYDFSTQNCWGNWAKVRDITPGEEYRFLLTPNDPLFSELNTTFRCSCQQSVTSDDATISCNVYCPYTINIPANATSFHLTSLIYNVTITRTSTGTITSSNAWGYWDHDQDHTDADDIFMGTQSGTTTTTVTWTNSSIPSTGARSFTNFDCDNWPNYCTYYIYLNGTLSFTTPGGSTRNALINVSLNRINYTIDYTVPGPFSVALNSPLTGTYSNSRTVTFNYTQSNSNNITQNCSVFTNETSWSAKNTTTLPANNTPTLSNVTFTSDGTYLWNVRCIDATSTTWGPVNYTITVDATPPIISQISPADGVTNTTTTLIDFTYMVNDTSGITNCSLYIDGQRTKDDTTVASGTNEVITQTLINGVYNWSIGCFDNAGHFNITANRSITISAPMVILNGWWYESDTANCTTATCLIDLAQSVDGTANTISSSIPASTTEQWVQADSTPMGANGGYIPSGSTVTFSSYFSAVQGNINAYWYLYHLEEGGTTSLICSNTGGTAAAGGAASTGTCTPGANIRLQSTDQFRYRIDLRNTHPSQARTFTHDIDHLSSFVNVTQFTQIGTLSTARTAPTSSQMLLQGSTFTLACNVTCTGGTCLSTNVYAQTNASGSWTNIGGSGVVNLTSGETNPHNLGNIFNTTSNTSFNLTANTPGTTWVRCSAQSTYSSTETQSVMVTVTNNQAPIITLNTPANNSWQSVTNLNFTYTPLSFSAYTNCSLYLNSSFNQTNQSSITNNAQNGIVVNNIPEERYNWSITCIDQDGFTGNSTTWFVDVDRTAPWSITLHEPPNATNTSTPTILFNWTVTDNRAANLSCDLYINSTINRTVTAINNESYNLSVGVFAIGSYNWRVRCTDFAGNQNTSETRYFTVSDEAPSVNLITPANNSGYNSTLVTFIYNASDNYQLSSCNLYLNGTFNQSNQTPLSNGLNQFIGVPLWEGGPFNWSVTCFDDAGNNRSTSNFSFLVDTTFPSVSLNAPPNTTLFNSSTVTFEYTATDENSVLACLIHIDGVANISSTPVSGVTKSETGSGYADGFHLWNVSCGDIANNTAWSETWEFTINETPSVILFSPANGTHLRLNATLLYVPTDNDGFAICELYLNGAPNQTNETAVNSSQQNNFTLTPSEGYYNWSVVCTDAGVYANQNQSEMWSFVIDNTPPHITLENPQNSTTITTSTYLFNWTATDNFATALLCNVSINSTVNQTDIVSPNGAIGNVSISGLRTGNYTWDVTCIDNATNVNTSLTWDFNVLLPPKITLVRPLNSTWSSVPTVNFTYIPSEGSGTFPSCTLLLNGATNTTNNTIDPEVENNLSATLADGRYDWNVQCIDTNSLTGIAAQNFTHYVDTRAPYNVSLLSPLNGSTVIRNNVSLTFIQYDAMSPNATCDITLDDGFGPFTLASGLVAFNATNYTHYEILPDGNYSWSVTCTDNALWSNWTSTWDFNINAPPNVTLINPPASYWNNTGDITFTYVPDDDILIKNCSLYIDGTINQSSAIILNKQNNSFSLNDMPSGSYNWTVGCFDSDNNLFTPMNSSLYIDYADPAITLNAPADTATLLTSYVTFNWTPQDDLSHNLTCDLVIDGAVNTSAVVNNSISYATTVGRFTDGSFQWNVTCVDLAQNSNTSETRDFTVAEPPIIMLNGPPNGTRTANASVNFTYTPDDNSGSIVACALIFSNVMNATNATPVVLNVANNLTSEGLTHATYLWNVNCTDPSGNIGYNSTNYTLHIDQLGPYINLTAPEQGETFNSGNITFNWTATDFPNTTIICNISVSNTSGTVTVTGITNTSGSIFTAAVPYLDDGSHDWNVTCIDDLGNMNTSLTYSFIINQPDLVLNDSDIRFNNTNPGELETINVTANVSNIGGIDAANTNITFWDGDPQSGGIYLGSMIQTVPANNSRIFWVLWNITPGYHTIHARADPDDIIKELNEMNNNASRNISYINISVTHPPNNSIMTDSTPEIHFNITDFTVNNLTYTIFVDGTFNSQTASVSPDLNTTLELNAIADGIHRIVVQATDSIGRSRNSTMLFLRIDNAPPITTFLTQNGSMYGTSEVTIRFNITDFLSTDLSYTVYLDGSVNTSGTTTNGTGANVTFGGLTEGAHAVIVQASDEVGNTANSTTLTFYVDFSPPIPNITTANGSWFNTGAPQISFNITDNLDSVLNYSFFVDGAINVNGSVVNASAGTATLSGLTEGDRTIILQAFDDAGNYANSTPITIRIDLTAPNVTLLSPANDTNLTVASATLNFTASDNFASTLACSVRLDGTIVQSDNLSNGSSASYTASGLTSGYHYWNVTCADSALNYGLSETWRFYIQVPDFVITTGNITFNNTAPIENETILVNATVFNLGQLNVTGNVTVQFWLGNPSGGGTQIGGNHILEGLSVGESKTVTTIHNAIIGINQLYVIIDPPLATNGTYPESNESNNIANRDFWVGLFEVFAGGAESNLHISDANIVTAFSWEQADTNGSNVFVVDSDSSISFTALRAIGRNATDGTDTGQDDFEEIDIRLNTTMLNDSVNRTFTSSGSPHGLRNISAYKRTIIDVPITNTTNTTSFVTGILWDSSSGGAFYNGSQDIVFMTLMNQSQIGQFGIYDYEIKVPAKLRDYIPGGGTVTFYTELR